MCPKAQTYDNQWIHPGDWVAVYDQLEALHYTVDRPAAPTKAVRAVDRVEAIDGAVKLQGSGWWPRSRLLKLTIKLVRKWQVRYGQRRYISDGEVRAGIADYRG